MKEHLKVNQAILKKMLAMVRALNEASRHVDLSDINMPIYTCLFRQHITPDIDCDDGDGCPLIDVCPIYRSVEIKDREIDAGEQWEQYRRALEFTVLVAEKLGCLGQEEVPK